MQLAAWPGVKISDSSHGLCSKVPWLEAKHHGSHGMFHVDGTSGDPFPPRKPPRGTSLHRIETAAMLHHALFQLQQHRLLADVAGYHGTTNAQRLLHAIQMPQGPAGRRTVGAGMPGDAVGVGGGVSGGGGVAILST